MQDRDVKVGMKVVLTKKQSRFPTIPVGTIFEVAGTNEKLPSNVSLRIGPGFSVTVKAADLCIDPVYAMQQAARQRRRKEAYVDSSS